MFPQQAGECFIRNLDFPQALTGCQPEQMQRALLPDEYCFAPDVHYHARLERDMAPAGHSTWKSNAPTPDSTAFRLKNSD